MSRNVKRRLGIAAAQARLTERAKIEDNTAMARRVVKGADFLTMQHQHFVVVINLLRVPIGNCGF